uniref:TNFR-Cys domain-containing protein n=1 Tax=Erpetoichthys calabaricus TaxID=27687 RepID=A0A8C4T994_ERPCA
MFALSDPTPFNTGVSSVHRPVGCDVLYIILSSKQLLLAPATESVGWKEGGASDEKKNKKVSHSSITIGETSRQTIESSIIQGATEMHLLSLWTSVALMISLVVTSDENLSRYCGRTEYFDFEGDESCKQCRERFPIKPGFEFSRNCGIDDFGNSPLNTYQECRNGTYNNGEFDLCQQCSTCQADVERIICSTTHDTLCCASGEWIESGLCPPACCHCSERNQQISRSSFCPKTHFNCKQVEGQPCQPEEETTFSITVSTTIPNLHRLDLTTNQSISGQTATPILTEQTTKTTLTEEPTSPNSTNTAVALPVFLTLAILLIFLVIFCVYKCWAKMKAAPKMPSLYFHEGGPHLDQDHLPTESAPKQILRQPLMMPQANGLHREDSVDKIDIKVNDLKYVHQNHLPKESASKQVLQKPLMMPQENGLHRDDLIDKIHMEVNGEPVSLPRRDNSLNEILGSELHTAPLQTVLNNLDVLEELIMLLDPEISNTKSTKHLASRCQFPSTWINYTYSMKDSKSPLKVLLEAVSAKWPDWTVGQLAVMLSDMERNDAVKVLTKLSPIQQEVL